MISEIKDRMITGLKEQLRQKDTQLLQKDVDNENLQCFLQNVFEQLSDIKDKEIGHSQVTWDFKKSKLKSCSCVYTSSNVIRTQICFKTFDLSCFSI